MSTIERSPRRNKVEAAPVAPATILVADDDDSSRVAIRRALVDDGYDVVEARDGADTLELLACAADSGTVPDVVVLDVRMPRFSGLGVLRMLRAFGRPPATVVVTAFADRSVDVFAHNFGAFRVLHKPLDLDELRATVLAAALHARNSGPIDPR